MAGRANMLLRMAGGLILLLLLVLAAGPAFAHVSHDSSGEAMREQSAPPIAPGQGAVMSPAPLGGMPDSQLACDACASCCSIGACSMSAATLVNGPTVTVRLPVVSGRYGRVVFPDTPGLRSIPDTRPPQLDA